MLHINDATIHVNCEDADKLLKNLQLSSFLRVIIVMMHQSEITLVVVAMCTDFKFEL